MRHFVKIIKSLFVISALLLGLPLPAQAQKAVTATHDLEIQLKLTDQGPGFKSDNDNILEAGESGALKFLVVNYGNLGSPDINLLMSSSFEPIDGLYVELPGLEPGEGVEFETQLEIPAKTDLSYIELSAEMFDKNNRPLAAKFEWKIINGTLLAASEVTGDNAAIVSTAYATMATRPGIIKGVVIDIENGSGLPADIIVRENKSLAKADANGYFSIEVSAGIYTLSFNYSGKRERIIEGIRVEGGSSTVVDVVLEPKDNTIAGLKGVGSVQEVVVQARADKTKASVQLVIRQKAPVVSDRLGSEEMSRAADSTAAKAVQRAVGTSVVGGKYIYVRGLGERYSYTTLNGAKLPSPEPNQKVVPLDIFPTAVIADVSIAKTAAPDMPADFAGGAVRVQTKEFPEERECSVGLGLGYTASATGKKIYAYDGGKTDWLGYDDGTRAIPPRVPADEARLSAGAAYRGGVFTDENMVVIAREFNNDYTLHQKTAWPDLDGSIACGDRIQIVHRPFGYFGAAKFGNSFERDFQVRRSLILTTDTAGQPILTPATDFKGQTGVQKSKASALANLNYSVAKGHQLDLVWLFTNIGNDEARRYVGSDTNFDGTLEYTSLRFVRRTLSYNQLMGEHDFGKAFIDWNGNYSLAVRDEPDWRELVRTSASGDVARWLPKSSSGNHYWSYLREPAYGGGLNIAVPFLQWSGLAANVKGGAAVNTRDRSFDVRRLRLLPLNLATGDYYALPPEELFTDEQFGVNVRLEEASRPTDNYKADEQVYATYAMTDLPINQKLRLIVGVRYEHSDISVTTFDSFSAVVSSVNSAVINDDILPSLNAVYALTDNMNLRASASQTVARPDFRELSPFALADFYGGQEVKGNPNLKETKIWNTDLRWEWFPGAGEVLSASLFFKQFIDPIEQVIIPSAQQQISFENARGANNYGVELEVRRNLGFIASKLRPIYGGGNFTWLRSSVELDPNSGVQTRSKRPLQGQSDLLGNAVLGVDFDGHYVCQLSYNVFSRRIAQVGAFGLPDIKELPFHSLNLTYKQKFAERWSFDIALENLLDEAQRLKQGGVIVERNYQGIGGSAGVDFTF